MCQDTDHGPPKHEAEGDPGAGPAFGEGIAAALGSGIHAHTPTANLFNEPQEIVSTGGLQYLTVKP